MTEKLTKNVVLDLLERAVNEKGADYIDPNASDGLGSCAYADMEGNPLCIVGHVLSYAGMELTPGVLVDPQEAGMYYDEDYDKERLANYAFGTGRGVGMLYANDDDVILPATDWDVIDILAVAQKVQDNGKSWGAALAEAKKKAGVTQ